VSRMLHLCGGGSRHASLPSVVNAPTAAGLRLVFVRPMAPAVMVEAVHRLGRSGRLSSADASEDDARPSSIISDRVTFGTQIAISTIGAVIVIAAARLIAAR